VVKLVIENIDEYIYTLSDENNKKYVINLDFWDIDNKPNLRRFIIYK